MEKKEYLVIYRNDNEPCMLHMSHEEVERHLNDGWVDLDVLRQVPHLDLFPAYSILILKGNLYEKEAIETVIKWVLKEKKY